MTRVLLIDLSSLAHPIFHMSASEPDPNHTSTAVVARVRALTTEFPSAAVCCDSGRCFRKDLDPAYKAQRPESDATLQHQIQLARDILRRNGFPVWSARGFEADDVLATATMQILRTPDTEVVIASSDKDLLQLVSARVSVHSLTSGTVYDPAAVREKFGVDPNQFVDWLSLVGDAADNVKGAKGIGPKTATALLTKYGTLDDALAAVASQGTAFTPALAGTLREFQTRANMVRALVTLREDIQDLPIDEVYRARVPVLEDDEAVFLGEDASPADAAGHQEPLGVAPVAPAVVAVAPEPAPAAPLTLAPNASMTPGEVPPRPLLPPAGLRAPQEPAAAPQPIPAAPRQELVLRESDSPAPAPDEWERQLEPRSMAQAKALAVDLFQSRLFSAYGNAPAVLSVMLAGRELGMTATASLRGFHIIEGKPTLAADLIRALVIRSGQAAYFRCIERTAERATFTTKRGDDPDVSLSVTIEEGRAAFVGDDKAWARSGWGKNPADMLVARAGSKLARLVYPDVVHGFYAREELE